MSRARSARPAIAPIHASVVRWPHGLPQLPGRPSRSRARGDARSRARHRIVLAGADYRGAGDQRSVRGCRHDRRRGQRVDVKWLVVAAVRRVLRPRRDEAARRSRMRRGRGRCAPAVPAGPYKVDATFDKGDVQIRVEWKDVPVEARAVGGAHGVRHGEGAGGRADDDVGDPGCRRDDRRESRQGRCRSADRFDGVRARALRVVAARRDRRVTVDRRERDGRAGEGDVREARARRGRWSIAGGSSPRRTAIQLPIAGHEAALALDPDSIDELRSDDDSAIAVVRADAVLRDHRSEWPGRAARRARRHVRRRRVATGARRAGSARGRGKVTVTAGGLAEVTLSL